MGLANFTEGVAVQLLHGGTRIFETTSTGVLVDTDSSYTRIQLNSPSNSIGELRFLSNNLILYPPSGGSSQLNYGSSKKLETTNTGVTVTGTVAATSYTGDGSSLTGVASAVADGCIYENSQTISNNYTISTNKNALSAGPITIANGVTLTIPTGSVYTIV